MLSDQIEERIKGLAYAHEPGRVILFDGERATFHGRHSVHTLRLYADGWLCDCGMWSALQHAYGTGWCRHTLAVERILESNLIPQAVAILA